MSGSQTERWTVVFEGCVQGVGFRITAARAARRLGIPGWVRNQPDGSVRLTAEDTPQRLDELLALIRADMPGFISSERIERSAASGEFDSFEIRR
ncbi:MAG: acylphosphatase [Phycisphaerales bacterium]|nr:acylphosphatase [Phycisphaerales bacterium]